MNKISGKTNRTVVKIFINICTSIAFFSFSTAFAAEGNNGSSKFDFCADYKSKGYKTAEECLGKVDPSAKTGCSKAREDYKQAITKISEACKKAGLGDKDCVSKSLSCAETSSEDSFDTMDVFGTALGIPPGTSLGAACPTMNGRDYFSEKDKIQKEIKETEKELAELNDTKADIQDDYNKEVQDIQETLNKAQEDYKKKEVDLDQEERERIADFHNNQNQAKEALRKKGSELLTLRGQMIQLQRDKARSLNLMSESAGKRKCITELAKMKEEYQKLYSSSAGASSNHIAQAKRKKKELVEFYNTCISDFNQQRIALNEQTRQKQDELDKQVRDTQSSMDEIQNSLNLAASQLEEMKQATVKKKNDALQAVIDLGTRSQQKMQAAYAKLQEKLKTLATKNASLAGALNRANQSLMTLGPAPKRGAEYTPADASSDISAQVNILMEISEDPELSDCGGISAQAEKAVKEYNKSKKGLR